MSKIFYGSKRQDANGDDNWLFTPRQKKSDTHVLDVDLLTRAPLFDCKHLEINPKGMRTSFGFEPICRNCGIQMRAKSYEPIPE